MKKQTLRNIVAIAYSVSVDFADDSPGPRLIDAADDSPGPRNVDFADDSPGPR